LTPAHKGYLQQLKVPLERLESMGFARPPGYSLERYLEEFAKQGLIDSGIVSSYLLLYSEVRFGEKKPYPQELHNAVERLDTEVVNLEYNPDAEILKARLRKSRAGNHAIVKLRPSVNGPPKMCLAPTKAPALKRCLAPLEAAGNNEKKPAAPPVVRTMGIIVLIAVVWTAVAGTAGYLMTENIDSVRQYVKRKYYGDSERKVDTGLVYRRMKAHARNKRGNVMLWWKLGQYAERRGHYEDAVVAFQRVISINPRHAMALNNLAWMHLTAGDDFVHNPERALVLAKRAFAISQEPFITDTLAEAHYQNGNFELAVRLEKSALARVKKDRGFYVQQLEKFSTALENRFEPEPVCKMQENGE